MKCDPCFNIGVSSLALTPQQSEPVSLEKGSLISVLRGVTDVRVCREGLEGYCMLSRCLFEWEQDVLRRRESQDLIPRLISVVGIS